MSLEAVDGLFKDRDNKRPSILRVVRDSADRDYLKAVETELFDHAVYTDVVKEKENFSEQIELAKHD
jgi:hypothetical protein